MHKIKVGLIGLGTVGGGVVDILNKHAIDFQKRAGVDLELVKCADLNTERFEQLGLKPNQCTTDAFEVINDPHIDVVIELIGGTGIAAKVVRSALEQGKNVVTANKALMASSGGELLDLAQEEGLDLRFEASVGGGIPIIGPLKHSLVSNEISKVLGIVNGTTNYMLTRMSEEGIGYDEALAAAQELGYAEADPSADVDGYDAAAKIAILSSIAFNSRVRIDQVFTQGIRSLDAQDVEYAHEVGYEVKLLAIGTRTKTGVDVRVHPTMIPRTHPLASVNGVFNAIYVVGDSVGQAMFFGEGAGASAAASAVVGDLIEMARDMNAGNEVLYCTCVDNLPVRSIDSLSTRYYIRMIVQDRSGVLAQTAAIFARHNVSIKSLIQRETKDCDDSATMVYVTHNALEGDMNAALKEISMLEFVTNIATVVRVEDLG